MDRISSGNRLRSVEKWFMIYRDALMKGKVLMSEEMGGFDEERYGACGHCREYNTLNGCNECPLKACGICTNRRDESLKYWGLVSKLEGKQADKKTEFTPGGSSFWAVVTMEEVGRIRDMLTDVIKL